MRTQSIISSIKKKKGKQANKKFQNYTVKRNERLNFRFPRTSQVIRFLQSRARLSSSTKLRKKKEKKKGWRTYKGTRSRSRIIFSSIIDSRIVVTKDNNNNNNLHLGNWALTRFESRDERRLVESRSLAFGIVPSFYSPTLLSSTFSNANYFHTTPSPHHPFENFQVTISDLHNRWNIYINAFSKFRREDRNVNRSFPSSLSRRKSVQRGRNKMPEISLMCPGPLLFRYLLMI